MRMRNARTALSALLLTAVLAAAPAFAQCPSGVTATPVTNPAPTNGTFYWSVTNGVSADFYILYFGAQGSGCSTSVLTTSRGGPFYSADYVDLAPNTDYEWRVEAVKNGCATVSSSCATFHTGCSTTGPTLISPPEGATDDHLKTTFAWDPVFGAISYDVWVAINGAPATKVGSTTGTDLTVDIAPGTHRWYVEAVFGGACPPARSATQTFGTSCPTTTTTLVSPAEGVTLQSPADVRFEWTAVSGADGYDVYVSRNGAAAAKIGETREGVDLAGTTITFTLPGSGNYVWFVDALSSGCPTRRSGNGSFVIADNCPKTPPTGNAPANNANITGDVTFSWSAVTNGVAAGLTGYNVWVALSGGAAAILDQTTATTLTTKLPPGSHSWFVEAVFTECPALRSGTNNFTVTAPSQCPTVGPALLSPPAGGTAVSSPVPFSWGAVTGATSYILFAGVNGAAPENVAQVTGLSASILLPEGSITWYVEVVIDGCANVRSETRTFSITLPPACPTVGAELVQPAANATITRGASDAPIALVWKAVTGVRTYSVTVIRGGVTSVIPDLDTTILSNHSSLDATSGTFEWFVTANFEGACAPVASEHRFFTVVEPPPCIVPASSPVAPHAGEVLNSQAVTFRWTAVQGATSYHVFARRDADKPPEFVGSVPGGATELQVTLPFGANEWYVEVIGATGCITSRSVNIPFELRRAVVCNTRAVELQSPAGNALLSSPVQLVWNAVNGATGYQAFTQRSGGSPTAATDVTTDLSTTVALPGGEYEWFVVAYFPGCDPAISEHRRFTAQDCDLRPPQLTSPLGQRITVTSPVSLAWTPVRNATSYDVLVGTNGEEPSPIASVKVRTGTSDETRMSANLPAGGTTWYIRAQVPGCPPSYSAPGNFTVIEPVTCTTPEAPSPAVQPEVTSAQPYPVVWLQVLNAASYEIEESTTPDFTNATTRTVTTTQETFSHGAAIDTTYYYRVRAKSSCDSSIGPYSNPIPIIVRAPASGGSTFTASVGSQQNVVQSVFVPGTPGVTLHFAARTDKPWLHVLPATGDLPPAGVTLTVTADTEDLQTGGNTGNVIVEISGSGKITPAATTPATSVPVNVNLVSPVLPSGKDAPLAESLIVPAVASAAGANGSFFQSDVRVANISGEAARYMLLFTPSGADSSRVGQQATVDIGAGQTVALDNLLRTWFGSGQTQNATGLLEVRPLRTGAAASQASRSRSTIGSSRTFNSTANGTLGQFIPAIPFSKFAPLGQRLELLQVAESANYRTNLGLVEGSGNAASVRVTAYNGAGTKLLTSDYDLKPGEHRQINSLLRVNGITTENARFEVEVTSGSGKVTAYTSTVDNRTNDPLLVSATEVSSIGDTNLVLPGIADIDTGAARWRSDIRIFNAGTSAVTAALLYYPSDDPANPRQRQMTVAPGETKQIDDVLRSQFGVIGSGGAVHVRTTSNTKLLASARTYTDTTSGTYGQFIPAVGLKASAGRESGSIHALQIEESSAFRSNVGIAEVSGKAATVEITAVIPDSKSSPRLTLELQPNQFRQFNSLLGQMGLGATYNARVAVRVVGGEGRIAAYASNIDNKTQDPTYVPAEQ